MNSVKAIAGDSVDAAVIRPTAGFEQAHAGGVFHILCYDKDGNLKWEEKGPNLVVNTGLQYMVSTSLDAAAQTTTWYLGLISTLTSIVGGDTTPLPKPNPANLFYACGVAGADPRRCVYVGDDLRDIEAGRAAGMKTVAAAYGYCGDELPPSAWGADGLIETPLQLSTWLAPEIA